MIQTLEGGAYCRGLYERLGGFVGVLSSDMRHGGGEGKGGKGATELGHGREGVRMYA